MTARVFFVEDVARYNTADAERYGAPRILLTNAPSPFKTDVFANRVRSAIEHAQFNPAEDCFCMTGTQLNLALALSILCVMYEDPIKLLLFDAQTNTYCERIFQA